MFRYLSGVAAKDHDSRSGAGSLTIALHDFLLFAAPPRHATQVLEDKIRSFFSGLLSRHVDPFVVFLAYDTAESGRVTRLEFKRSLEDLGLVLSDAVVNSGGLGSLPDPRKEVRFFS